MKLNNFACSADCLPELLYWSTAPNWKALATRVFSAQVPGWFTHRLTSGIPEALLQSGIQNRFSKNNHIESTRVFTYLYFSGSAWSPARVIARALNSRIRILNLIRSAQLRIQRWWDESYWNSYPSCINRIEYNQSEMNSEMRLLNSLEFNLKCKQL